VCDSEREASLPETIATTIGNDFCSARKNATYN
jgi:hypothetical protein